MNETIVCEYCGNQTTNDSEFCIKCGSIFIDNVYCYKHSEQIADGVCAICHNAYCKKCGLRVNSIFLCNEHSDFEIYEGMAAVFNSYDIAQIEFLKSCLKKEGFNPFIYSRNSTPLPSGYKDLTLFQVEKDPGKVSSSEIRLVVPCSEVLQALEFLDEISKGGDIVIP